MTQPRETVRVVSSFPGNSQPELDYEPRLITVLRSIDQDSLRGLGNIILRNSRELGPAERKGTMRTRSGRVSLSRAKGLYYAGEAGEPARIELFIDNILSEWPRWIRRMPLLRDAIIKKVFFHELAHHLLRFRPASDSRSEIDADRLGRDWLARSFRQRHPVLVYPLWAVWRVGSLGVRLRASRCSKQA